MMFQFLFGLFIFFTANNLSASVPPMVERHIFIPGDVTVQKENGFQPSIVHLEAIQKEILFTGLLITPKGKQAIITENPKSDGIRSKNVLREGDQIKGMTIKEIGSNYLLLAGREGDVRLNLYRGTKNRPAFNQAASMPVTQTTVISSEQNLINQKTETPQSAQTRGFQQNEVNTVFPSGSSQQGLPATSRTETPQQGLPATSGAGTNQLELPSGAGSPQQDLPVSGGGNIPQHAFPPTESHKFVLPPIGGSQQGLPSVGTPLK